VRSSFADVVVESSSRASSSSSSPLPGPLFEPLPPPPGPLFELFVVTGAELPLSPAAVDAQ
jgi:hypothetical protein